MLNFRQKAGPAVYDAFLGINAASTTLPVETTICDLAGLDSQNDSVIPLFCEKNCRGDRRQRKYSDRFGQFLRSAIT